ncbi:MAG: dihydroorotase [Planctomycetes bacterium]|nr:dihydroorotase [Planctomycetota bacterium]
MSSILIKGGRVIDPANKIDKTANVFTLNGKIKSVGAQSPKADKVIDAKGLIVAPGLIDMHVHLREPGKEEEETIASGSAAAVNGGFTSVACMPNTEPAVDSEASAEFVYLQAKRTGKANIYPIGAITKGRKGVELSEMGQLVRGGAVTIISHCEDKDLVPDGVMNDGFISAVLGLRGMPNVAEEVMVYRDIALCELTGGKLHIAHITTRGAVELVRQAKKKGINVTAEVTPHHLLLTDESVKTSSFDPNYKMNPPLRTKQDIEALAKGLKDGTIDAIASDHAPHSPEEKDVEFNIAPFGIIGMETLLPLVLTELVNKKVITLAQAIAKLTVNPARILGLDKGTLTVGADADITLIDLSKEWVINPDEFKSKSRNCPFRDWKVKGKAVKVIVGGQVVN